MCSAKSKSKKQMWNTVELYPISHQLPLLSIINLMFFLQWWDFGPKLSNFFPPLFIYSLCLLQHDLIIVWMYLWLQKLRTGKKGNGTTLSKNALFYNKRSHWMPKLVMKETPSGSENSTREWSMMGISKLVLMSFLPQKFFVKSNILTHFLKSGKIV